IPIWIYVVGAGAAVALSAPAAAVAVREEARPARRSRMLYPALRRLRLGPIGLALTTILFGFVLVGGFGGQTVQSQEFFENPATVLVWVDFWVGLGIVSAFLGNLWDFVSPISAVARAVDRALARREVAPLAYPARLGQWPAVWLATRPEERIVRLRPWGAGLRSDPELPPGGGAFVLATLATVVFDGWSQTNRFATVEGWFLDRWSWIGRHDDLLRTGLMVAIVAAFVLAFLLVCALLGDGGMAAAARRYAPTLVPIAAVYFAAHYFDYILLAGQSTLGVLVDPLGHSWNPGGLGEYGLWKGIAPPAGVWWTQVVLIVVGHVAGVVAAHRVALRRGAGPVPVLARQA